MAKEICRRCRATLDGKVEYELPDGAKYGRCSRCQHPYVISKGKGTETPEPEPEPPEPEPTEE